MRYKKFKKISFVVIIQLIMTLFYIEGFAQSPKAGINFQAVAKDKAGNPANNRKIYIKSTILKGTSNGVVVFGEHHESNTNEFGIFNIVIGKGTRYTGVNDIYGIDWSSANFYFQLSIAITPVSPGLNWEYNKEWVDLGTVEFGVVPYALQSLSANTINMDTAILNKKLNVSDTSTILSPYALKLEMASTLYRKLNIADSIKYVTPYQLSSKVFDTSSLSHRINLKLNKEDTSLMLFPYLRQTQLSSYLTNKLNITDTATMLSPYLRQAQIGGYLIPKMNFTDTAIMLLPYLRQAQLSSYMSTKLNIADTANMMNLRITRDTIFLSTRINYKEDFFNKSVDVGVIADYNHSKYPSVKAIKDYVDGALIAGAPDATINNKGIILLAGDLTGSASLPIIATSAITTNKIQDAAVTDAKLATGISPSKVGLANVTNHAQLYSLNGLTTQVQKFGIPETTGLMPNWVSTGSNHVLNIPMAAASSVTAGLISKIDYDHFNTAYSNTVNNVINIGNNGVASITGNVLNIPAYTIIGLAGNSNPNTIFAGPASVTSGAAGFRSLVAADIPNNAANTLGNAASANKLTTAINLNNILFDGSSDISNLTANTTNFLTFANNGLGVVAGSTFNGSTARTISYNTIGAAPTSGSTNITTLGNIIAGTWNANIIGANYGGAGSNNGILKANGAGIVSVAIDGTDFQSPLVFNSPLLNSSNTITLPQATSVVSGYLANTDWDLFNNKIDLSQKASVNGVASLDANGKIPTSQIPSISFSSGYVVINQAAMLALSSAVVGSIAIRTDNSKNYVLSGLPASALANWLELLMPVSIASVNGRTESSITLTSTDIGEGTNLYYTNTRARNALSAISPIVYTASTGVISIPAATASAAGYLSSSDWALFNSKMGTFSAQAPNAFYAGPSTGSNAVPSFRAIVAGDIPTLNQNTIGNAGTATKLAATKNINGVAFDGSADIIITSNISNAITFNNSGSGLVSPVSFDGSSAKTISYNTIGAAPAIGSSAITTVGSISSGTWLGSIIDANHGGAGTTNGILKANGAGVVSSAIGGTDFENPLTFSLPLSRASNSISLTAATSVANGYLISSDWSLFNGKQSSIVAGTGVSLSGGNTVSIGQSVATTVAPTFSGATLSGLNVAGIVTNTAGGVLGSAATTGTGNIVRANTPTLITPLLGDASATSLNAGTVTATSINTSGDITAKRFKLTMPAGITAATTTNLDLSTGNVFTVNLGMSITTLNLTNPGVGTYLIKFLQGGVGNWNVAFPAAWKWAAAYVPDLTPNTGKLDIVTLIYDGANYYATIVQNF